MRYWYRRIYGVAGWYADTLIYVYVYVHTNRTDGYLWQWESDILSKQQTGKINIKDNKCYSTKICNWHQFQPSGIKCFASQTHNDSQLLSRFLSFFHYKDWVWLLPKQHHHHNSFSYCHFVHALQWTECRGKIERKIFYSAINFCSIFL